MKLHSSLMTAVTETVYQIFHDQKMADKAIQHVLKSNKKWGSRDRAFIAENCYEMVRWWRLLHFINESRVNNLHPSTLMRLLGILLRMKGIDLPEWSEFKGLSRSHIKFRYDEAQKIRKVKESIPDWLDQLGADELGEKWESVLSSLNVTAPLTIRVNTLKTNYSQLAMALIPHGVKLHPIPDVPNATRVEERSNLFSLPEFKEGLMMLLAKPIGDFVSNHPTIKMLALSFLVVVGVVLIADGFGHHVPKGYIYFAMAFSVAVEMLNIRMRKKATRPVDLREPYAREMELD